MTEGYAYTEGVGVVEADDVEPGLVRRAQEFDVFLGIDLVLDGACLDIARAAHVRDGVPFAEQDAAALVGRFGLCMPNDFVREVLGQEDCAHRFATSARRYPRRQLLSCKPWPPGLRANDDGAGPSAAGLADDGGVRDAALAQRVHERADLGRFDRQE